MSTKAHLHFVWCATRRSLQNSSMASFRLYIPTEVSLLIIHWTLENPSCALWFWRGNPLVHHPSRSGWFRRIPAFLAPPFGAYKTNLYHLLGQVVRILGSWWHMFILGDLSKNRSLIWFRWHIKLEDYRLPLDIASNHRLPRTQFPNRSPKSYHLVATKRVSIFPHMQ
jgi:hypothetical protein